MPISTTKEAHAYYAEHGALPEGFRWVRVGGHSVALPSKREGLNFKFIVPPFFRTSPSVEIGSFKPFGSSVTSGFINVAKAAAYAISTDSSIDSYVENEFKQKTSNLMEELREAFRANLNRVSPVSNSREVRRAAFTALGVGKQLHGIDEAYENPLVSVSDEENLPALSNPALHRYLQEISQYELLTREETDELAVRFREDGDQDAAYRLVSSNLRLVVKVAMDFQKYWMQNFMDLIQEGNVGLVQATKKFDPYHL